MQLIRPLQTRFRFGSVLPALNLAAYRNSPVRSTKSTRSRLSCALSACKHRVSGSLSLPSRGSFHLSLTVLYAIGRQPSLALEGGPPCFPPDFTCPAVLWCRLAASSFCLRDCYPLWSGFPTLFRYEFAMRYAGPQPQPSVESWFGLIPFRSPLLRESFLLSFPPGT